MKKVLVLMAAATTVAFAGSALADVDEGRITEIKSWAVKLERQHQFYSAPSPAMLEQLKVGDMVRVTYSDPEGEKQIVSIQKLPQQ